MNRRRHGPAGVDEPSLNPYDCGCRWICRRSKNPDEMREVPPPAPSSPSRRSPGWRRRYAPRPRAYANILRYLNETLWPIFTRTRAAPFSELAFVTYAAQTGAPLLDIAGDYPRDLICSTIPFREPVIAVAGLNLPAAARPDCPTSSVGPRLAEAAAPGGSSACVRAAGAPPDDHLAGRCALLVTTESDDPFFVRARRALRRRPAYLARRVVDSVRRRARRPWLRTAPHLFTDRVLLLLTGAASIDALWRRQRERPFFFSPGDRERWTQAFTAAFPEARRDILAVADAALRHEFDLLGSGPTRFGDRLPWHTDFKAGREWAVDYACEIQYAELDRPTDVKVPWELSRCQHFTALGQAYWLTGDDRYAREFVAETDDWIASNPWGYGVNWACAMDIALRAVSWLWAFYFADSAPCRSPEFRGRFLRSLFLHGDYRHPSRRAGRQPTCATASA